MPFPSGLATVLVRYTAVNPAGGGPAAGTVEFAPTAPVVKVPGFDEVFTGRGTYRFDGQGRLVDGDQVGVRLLPNNLPGTNPAGWLWMVTVRITGAPVVPFYVRLDAAVTEVDLGDLQQLDPQRASYVAVRGPAGPQGEPGPPGADGQDGINGTDGADGLDGAPGTPGAAGATGPAGAKGDQGDPGPTGATGPAGPKGDTGNTGPTGATGPAGADGAQGLIGLTGPTGPTGPEGPQGAQPPLGAAGAGDGVALKSTDPTTTNPRTPTAHAASHATGGADPITPDSIGAYRATYGNNLNGYVTDLQERVGGTFGLENRATALESGKLPTTGGTIGGSLAVTGNALGEDKPAAHGIAAWCYDPALAVNTTELSNGRLYLTRVNIAADVSVSRIYWWVGNTGSSPVSGQNQVGLYNPSGTLLASTNVDAAISSAGLKSTVIAAQGLVAGSFYWVGMVFNASVPPTLTRASGWTGVDAAANLGLSAATLRFATNGTSRTSLPASITPGSNVGTDFAGPWAAVGQGA